MVYSGSKRSTQLHSYNNGDFGGGMKKAGLPFQVGRTSAISYAFRQTSQNMALLGGQRYVLYLYLQGAIKAFAEKQLLADSANTAYMESVSTLQDKYNAAIALYGDGTQFDDNTDIDAALTGLVSPADDAKITILNEIKAARTVKATLQIALDTANAELASGQILVNDAQTAYDNA
jgi:hypothetical protein